MTFGVFVSPPFDGDRRRGKTEKKPGRILAFVSVTVVPGAIISARFERARKRGRGEKATGRQTVAEGLGYRIL